MSKKIYIDPYEVSPVYVDGKYYYTIRYRIVSDNKNRVSEWTPFYDIEIPPYDYDVEPWQFFNPSDTTLRYTTGPTGNPDGSQVTIIYPTLTSSISSKLTNFDVFIRRGTGSVSLGTVVWGDWEYLNTQAQGPVTIISESQADLAIDVSIHMPAYPKSPPLADGSLDNFLQLSSVQVQVS